MCKLTYWLLALVICGLIGSVINFVTCIRLDNRHVLRDEVDRTQSFLADQGSGVFSSYSVWMMLVTMVLFLLVSLILKVFSKNFNHVPFSYSRR